MNAQDRETDLALELGLYAQNAVMAWANEGELHPLDIEAQTIGVMIQAVKLEAEKRGLPWSRLLAEVDK